MCGREKFIGTAKKVYCGLLMFYYISINLLFLEKNRSIIVIKLSKKKYLISQLYAGSL